MYPLRRALAALATAALCVSWCLTVAGQRRSHAGGGKPAPRRAHKLPAAPAAGGGSDTKTQEEADAQLEAGEMYVDPDFVPGSVPSSPAPSSPASRKARAAAPEAGGETSSAAAELLEEADGLFDSGNYTQGLAAYRRVVSEYPRSLEAQLALGGAYNAMGEYGSAFEPFVQALRLAPGNAEAQYGIGHAYVNVDKPKEALPFLRAAVRLEPDSADAHYDLGLAYAMLNNKKAALAEYQALTRLDADLAEKLNEAINQ